MQHDVKMVNWECIGADNVHKNETIDWSQRDCSENVASWGYVCLALVNIYIYKGINGRNKRAKNGQKTGKKHLKAMTIWLVTGYPY